MKKNLPLIIALAMPLVLTVVVVGSVYLPVSGQTPQHDFIYTVFNHREPSTAYYDVKDGKIVQVSTQQFRPGAESEPLLTGPGVQLFYYDVQTHESRELSFEETSEYRVDSSWTSPDGYRVEYGNDQGVFPFFFDNASGSGLYLIGNGRRINTSVPGYDASFLGWVINE